MVDFNPKNIAIIGASGAIGGAFREMVSEKYPDADLHVFSSHGFNHIDYDSEESICACAELASQDRCLDLVLVTNGALHGQEMMPEKSLKELSAEKFHHFFQINAVVPALIAKYFLPKLNRHSKSVLAVLSARVGSISDNHLGGWYAYRSSKAALNMIIKNAAIESGRINKQSIVVGLHPGTVDSSLSKPFQSTVPENKLFTPEYAAEKLLWVLENTDRSQTGKCIAWDGQEILP